jgi:hypothetical protein
MTGRDEFIPILRNKLYAAPSAFKPENPAMFSRLGPQRPSRARQARARLNVART